MFYFPDLNRIFKIYLLKESAKYINLEDGHIKLDNEVHFIKKSFKIKWKDDTLDNLRIATYLVKTLDEVKKN